MNRSQSRRKVLQSAATAGTALFTGGTSANAQSPGIPLSNDPRSRLEAMIFGHRLAQMIHVAAKLGIADYLRQGPMSVHNLAEVTQTHQDSLYRLLRTLAGLGIFAEEDGPSFRLTPMADFLRSDVPESLRVSSLVQGEGWGWKSWGDLSYSVKTGKPAFEHVFGKQQWDWFAENPGPAELFNSFMTEITTRDSQAVLSAYDFSRAKTVVDVAGGQGSLLAAILGRQPAASGVLFDLPKVIESARKVVDRNIAGRIRFVQGDFFKSIPEGGDVYLLKNIIHDWNDSQSKDILSTCRRAMGGNGRLLIIEHVVCGPNIPCAGKMADVQMMVILGGRNRTEKEYSDLLQSSGFKLTRVIPTKGPAIIEAAPA